MGVRRVAAAAAITAAVAGGITTGTASAWAHVSPNYYTISSCNAFRSYYLATGIASSAGPCHSYWSSSYGTIMYEFGYN